MNNNFEQLRKVVSVNQEKILSEGGIVSRKKTQESSNLVDLISQRIDNNIKILEDVGVIELFQKIKSENLLGEDTELETKSLEEFKELKNRGNIRSYIPHVRTPEQWACYLDHSIIVKLLWDPHFKNGGPDGSDSTTYREIAVFVNDNKPVLVHSTSKSCRGSEPKMINSNNLFELTTEALLSATRDNLDINPSDFSSLYRR
jgi:hypothetical protein